MRLSSLVLGFQAAAARLTAFERLLAVSVLVALTSSLFIGLFYAALKAVIAFSALVHGVDLGEALQTSDYSVIALESPNRLLIPLTVLAGALAASIIVYRFEPEAEGGGTDAAVHAYHFRAGLMKGRVAVVKAIASALLLGMGGSAGPEGPSIQIGGSSASALARLLRFSVEERKIVLVAGMAAALAFVFQAPIGSAIFAVEVLYLRDFAVEALVPSLFSAVIGYTLSIHILGVGHKLPALHVEEPFHLFTLSALASYIGLGLLIVPFSLLYIYSFRAVKEAANALVERLGIPLTLKPVLGAAPVAVLGFLVPHVLGTGEDTLASILSALQRGALGVEPVVAGMALSLLLLAVLKILATSLTVGSGGSGGLLAPGLFAGAMVGALYGVLVHPYTHVSPAVYAYIGMATLFGSASKVSLGLSLFIAEIAGTPFLVVPALIASLTASILVGSASIVESQLPHRVHPRLFTAEYLLKLMTSRRICIWLDELPLNRLPALSHRASLSEAVATLIARGLRLAPVVDEQGRVIGVLDPGYLGLDLDYAVNSREPLYEVTLARPPLVGRRDCVTKALREMIAHDTDYAIVVNDEGRYEGVVFLDDIVSVLTPWLAELRVRGKMRPNEKGG